MAKRVSKQNEPLLTVVQGASISEDDIRQRAFQIYLERGASSGSDQEDWLRAERELRGQ